MPRDDFTDICAQAARATLADAAAHENPDDARLLEMAADNLLEPPSVELPSVRCHYCGGSTWRATCPESDRGTFSCDMQPTHD